MSLILAGLVMVAIVGIAAIVVDLGYARQRKRQVQSGADAAALAGVVELPDSTAATTVARAYVTANGMNGAAATVNVPPTSGAHAGDSSCIEVIPTEAAPTFFGTIFNASSIAVSARAVACTTAEEGGMAAIFAGATTCGDKTLKFSGSNSEVVGGMHSNARLDISGSNNAFTGSTVTYTTTASVGGSGNTFQGSDPSVTTTQPYPVTFNITDYAPGGARAVAAGSSYRNAGSNEINKSWLEANAGYSGGVLQPGLYYTTNKISLADSGITVAGGGGVTFVTASNTLEVSGGVVNLTPFEPDLLLFSNYMKSSPLSDSANCDSGAISVSGSSSNWEGIIYAPRGSVKFNGSSNVTVNGSVVAHSVEVSGSTISFNSESDSPAEEADTPASSSNRGGNEPRTARGRRASCHQGCLIFRRRQQDPV